MSGTNPLAPMQASGGAPAGLATPDPAPHPAAPHMPALTDQFQQAQAQYKKIQGAQKMLGTINSQLGELSKLGDMVSAEDVIKAAGHVVAGGGSPMDMAGFLADMPQGGQALQGWISDHQLAVSQNLQQAHIAAEGARHQLGVAGIHMLAAHSMTPASTAGAKAPQSGAPALAPASTDRASNPLLMH